jgi:hypothetical protein
VHDHHAELGKLGAGAQNGLISIDETLEVLLGVRAVNSQHELQQETPNDRPGINEVTREDAQLLGSWLIGIFWQLLCHDEGEQVLYHNLRFVFITKCILQR